MVLCPFTVWVVENIRNKIYIYVKVKIFIKVWNFLKFLPLTLITQYSSASLIAIQKPVFWHSTNLSLSDLEYKKMDQGDFNKSTYICGIFDNQSTYFYLNIERGRMCKHIYVTYE